MLSIRPPPGSRALRKGRSSVPGQQYLVTTVCQDRRRVFSSWATASPVAAKLGGPALWRDARALCWVLMPDHLHALIELGPSEPLPALVRRIKSVTARTAAREADTAPPIWMAGFHDRALRRNEDAIAVARYLVANPIRAGLVAKAGDYPFWDAAWI